MKHVRSATRFFIKTLLILLFHGMAYHAGSQVPRFSGSSLKFPWAGGLNSCQFCAIDLNLDGINDLLIFDRHGNRKLTLVNHGSANTIDYSYAPDYALQLPELHDWVITADYNCDGKMDIFTYGMGGVRVFENISGTTLKFKLVTNLLESFYYTGKVGILVTSVDYPALADIDNDGDLDLLTFFGLGSYVEYHKNLSMEKYGHCDSLDFRLADPCWGKFKESEGGNKITLNVPCPYGDSELRITNYELRITNTDSLYRNPKSEIRNPKSEIRNPKSRHTGSTLLAIDLNNDGLKDLILGDVDYPNLVALYNGGTVDSAFMVAQDTAFPASSAMVHLFSFPAVSFLDIDNDGLKDLLISPFDPMLNTSDNYNSVWYYKNTGSVSLPHFEFQAKQLFRNEMMDFGSASHPVLFDIDGDGLQDLFVGNNGYYDSSYYENTLLRSVYTSQVAFFRNIGNIAAPVFNCLTDDLAGISVMNLRGACPALGDLNGDGRADMLIGCSDGTLIYFKNTGNSSGVPVFDPPVRNWQGIDAGDYSNPQIFDLDKDDVPDLIIGEQNGNLNYYKNTGTIENPAFTLITDSLGKVNVTNYNISYNGFSTPCFARRSNGSTFLLAGSDEGRIHLFENIDHNLNGKFTETSGLFTWLSSTPNDTIFGWQTSPAIGHITDTDAFDLITGNFSGGLNYITKRIPAEIIPGISPIRSSYGDLWKVYPNPANLAITIKSYDGTRCSTTGRIDNLYGQKVLEFPFNGLTTISVSDLSSGIYVIRIGEATSKLVIAHP
jgi:hypothetical protein